VGQGTIKGDSHYNATATLKSPLCAKVITRIPYLLLYITYIPSENTLMSFNWRLDGGVKKTHIKLKEAEFISKQ
jgi:hypothetical protein